MTSIFFSRRAPSFDETDLSLERTATSRLGAGPPLLLAAALVVSLGCGSVDDALNNATGGGSDAFSTIYASATFQQCSGCHAPGASGKVAGTEATENWSSRDQAFSSLKGKASGLIGNFAGCNGAKLIGSTAETSLLVAALDENTRASFQSPDVANCNEAAVSDQNLKLSSPIPAGLLQQLKDWIDSGAPDM